MQSVEDTKLEKDDGGSAFSKRDTPDMQLIFMLLSVVFVFGLLLDGIDGGCFPFNESSAATILKAVEIDMDGIGEEKDIVSSFHSEPSDIVEIWLGSSIVMSFSRRGGGG